MGVKAAARGLRPRLGLILVAGAALALAACTPTPGVDVDDIVSASIAGQPVSAADLAVIKTWIRQHRSGWETNLNSPPLGCSAVLHGRSDEFELILFPGPADPGAWPRTVLLGRLSSSKGPLMHDFPEAELAPLFRLARAYGAAIRPGECGERAASH
jgi:hypothetical protein